MCIVVVFSTMSDAMLKMKDNWRNITYQRLAMVGSLKLFFFQTPCNRIVVTLLFFKVMNALTLVAGW
jgi:hypothetical protein